MMAGTEYVLTGFSDFFERRRIAFVDPLPSTLVCGVCGLVSSQTLLLPWGHVLCLLCKEQIAKQAATCPLDGEAFTETDLVSMTFEQYDLEERQVFCVTGGQKCGFSGKLGELKEHLGRCCEDVVACSKCQRPVARSLALQHCHQCSGEGAPKQAGRSTSTAGVLEELGSMKRDLESFRGQASSGKIDQDAVVNEANSLVERISSVERELVQEGKGTGTHKRGSSLPVSKKAPANTGPYRAASKAGAFIATCYFRDIYAEYDALIQSKENEIGKNDRTFSTGAHTLAGYTFRLEGRWLKQRKGDVFLRFALFLGDGVWDDWLEWPFAKKVTIILTHPRDEGRDVRLPLNMNGPNVVKKPAPGSWKSCYGTAGQKWKDFEVQGFF